MLQASSASGCPMMHSRSTSMQSQPLYTIVVEQGKNPDRDGFIVATTTTDTDLTQFSAEIAKRMSTDISVHPSAIELVDADSNAVKTIEQLAQSRVVFLTTPLDVREAPMVPGYPLVGILPHFINGIRPALERFYADHGDTFVGHGFFLRGYMTRNYEIANLFMTDDEHFDKNMEYPFVEGKFIGGEGLLTSRSESKEWQISHRMLMPAFSASAMKLYSHQMVGVVEDACSFLSRNVGKSLDMVDVAYNMTFQIITRVGFSYDLHIFDDSDGSKHPFVDAMTYCVSQATLRGLRSPLWRRLPIPSNYKFDQCVKLMRDTLKEVIEDRKQSPDATNMKKDLLGVMLNARVPDESGELVGLPEEVVLDQSVTFIFAGTETTASTVAWSLYLLDKHPRIQRRLLQELADNGITPDVPPTVKQVSQLKFLAQVLKETLRLYPPLWFVQKSCKKDCILPGGYRIRKGYTAYVDFWAMQRNPNVFDDPLKFNPDRFSEDNSKNIPHGAWTPFSAGLRSCLGMQFALMEMRIALARLLSKFEFRTVSGKEVFHDQFNAIARPMGLDMEIHARTDFPMPRESDAVETDFAASSEDLVDLGKTAPSGPLVVSPDDLPRTLIVYGSNMGTSEDYSRQMAEQLKRMGYVDLAVMPLNKWELSAARSVDGKRTLVIVITSTYNGIPPDNAAGFAKKLDAETDPGLLKDVDFVLFGCGNSLWHTFLRFPRHVFDRLNELGARPLTDFYYGDSNDDLDEDYLQWSLQVGALIASRYGSGIDTYLSAVTGKALPFVFKSAGTTRAEPLRLAAENAAIKINQELQDVKRSGRSTRHIEITLDDSTGVSYKTGDHLNIYPVNTLGVVREVAAIMGLNLDMEFELEQVSDASRFVRSAAAAIKGCVCTVSDVLQYVCDWKEAPSRELANALSESSGDDAAYEALRKAADDVNTLGKQSAGWSAFTAQNRTVLDVLRTYAPLMSQVPFATLLHFVSAMAPRRYSIASCQGVVGNEVHISAAIVNDAVNGRSYGGLATEYLASLEPGARVSVSHLPAQEVFHLPLSSDVPVMFVGAGTGIAPFRGFLQEMKLAGIGGATMYFGCRSPEYDYLYKDELEQYVQDGTLSKLQTAFSRVGDERRYVQHHISADGARIWWHLQNGGRIYVCGSADKLAKDLTVTMTRIFEEHGGLSHDEASKCLSDMISDGRYAQDIW
ncbi:cytochrome P450 [Linderina pennispora]|uniref:NADPH--hemoprotein reductase n=1 Tax=Linderina pennispora TaxID=61395 RepID=A0A1Y1W3Y0_9FUNG|nr:cytochrome P450 [Linderina pennispora]ORX68270.1 cytochrome P450 [Linderina pennispora]